MRFRKGILGVLLCVLLISGLSERVEAKSLYAITKHSESIVQIYDIEGDRIELQRTCDDYPHEEQGAVGLTVDPNSRTLFSSYDKIEGWGEDGDNIIETVDAVTIKPINTVKPPEEVAGVVFDKTSQRLLAVGKRGVSDSFSPVKCYFCLF